MTSTSAFLADRLSELEAEALADLSVFADLALKVAHRAAAGQPIAATDALALLAARGYDPITRRLGAPRNLGKLDHLIIGMGVIIQMGLRKHSMRTAAKAMDVSSTAIWRLCTGQPVSINIVVKACVYLDIHPFDQCERLQAAA